MCTPKADSAATTVVDTGILRSFVLTWPGLSPRDESVADTLSMVLSAAPNIGPKCPGGQEMVVLGRGGVIELVDEAGKHARVFGGQDHIEL
jgi:hypothetical protein